MTKFLIRLRGLFDGNTPGIGLNPDGRSSGLTLERITIDDKRGATHTVFFGWTSYGKGHVPSGGHKPITTIEFADTHPSKEDDRHQRRKVLASRTEQ